MNYRRVWSAVRAYIPPARSKATFIGLFSLVIVLSYFVLFSTNVPNITSAYHSPRLEDMMADVRVKPVDQTPVSPLELIPEYDGAIQRKLDSSWDFLFKKSRYKHFRQLDLKTKCEFYFQNLYNMNKDWTNDFHSYAYDINEDDSHSDIVKPAEKDDDGVQLFDEASLKHYKKVHDISLSMERLRLYDMCFVNNKEGSMKVNELFDSSSSKSTEQLDSNFINADGKVGMVDAPDFAMYSNTFKKYSQWDFEHKMFPIIPYFEDHNFTNVMPIFTGADGKSIEQGVFPTFNSKTGGTGPMRHIAYDKEKSFWGNWNTISSSSGKRGIVLSAGDGQVDMCIRLIATLRAQGNKLPIQVIHNNQLSSDSIRRLSVAAQSTEFSKGIKQTIWYVNVEPMLDESVKSNFSRFKNKWLSVLFNTFEEFVFIDSDAISYINLEEYFNFDEYRTSGALFFKDRSLTISTSKKCPALFESLVPKLLESFYYGSYPAVDPDYVENQCMRYLNSEEKVYKNFFEIGHQHQLESGLLAVNKNDHIIGLAIATLLNVAPKIGGCGWGDKEFFWLGLLVAGQKYSIYDVDASAVGKSVQTKFVSKGDEFDQYQICSLQVAHTSYEKKLLWLNGGSQYCKNPGSFEDDWNGNQAFRETFSDDRELAEKAYTDVIDIDSAIVPDRKGGEWYRSDMRCKGYFWCAKYSSRPKPYTYNKKIIKGEMFKFDSAELENINNINKVWNDAVVQ